MIRGRGEVESEDISDDGFGEELMRVSKNTLILVLVAGFLTLGAKTLLGRCDGASNVRVTCGEYDEGSSSSSATSSVSERECCTESMSEGRCNGFTGKCKEFAAE